MYKFNPRNAFIYTKCQGEARLRNWTTDFSVIKNQLSHIMNIWGPSDDYICVKVFEQFIRGLDPHPCDLSSGNSTFRHFCCHFWTDAIVGDDLKSLILLNIS